MIEKQAVNNFREIAGIITAMIVVLLFCGLGIIQVVVFVTTGATVSFDADYKTALLGLASMMAGFLIGAQSDKTRAPSMHLPTTSAAVQTIETISMEGYAPPQSPAISKPPNEGSSGKK